MDEPKYKYLVKKRQQAGQTYLNDLTAFAEYSNNMDDIYENIDDYNPKRKRKVLIIFDEMIFHVMSDKKARSMPKELQKIKFITFFSDPILFFCSKRCKIKLYSLLNF